MPKRSLAASNSSAVMNLVLDFAAKLSAIVEVDSLARARAALDSVGAPPARGSGALGTAAVRASGFGERPAADASARALAGKPPRRKPPRQLCPVPGCKNTAAPIFGMVCGEHKNVPKSKIRKYREARKKAADVAKPAAKK